jgi:hypothetical protein
MDILEYEFGTRYGQDDFDAAWIKISDAWTGELKG